MFDIDSPEAFLRAILRNVDQLRAKPAKETDRLLFVIFALNHLREWIAPGHRAGGSPTSDSERFFESIYLCPSYRLINDICNHTKHLRPLGSEMTGYGLDIDDWSDVDSVENFDAGPPTRYEVNGKDVLTAVDEVIEFYQRNWFDRH